MEKRNRDSTFKKILESLQLDLKSKIGLAKQFSCQFAVRLCCSCLKLNPSTFYKAKNKQDDRFEIKYKNLKNRIKRIIIKNPAYGYRRIKDELKEEHNVIINAKTLRKLLNLWNFNILRKVVKPQRSGIEQIIDELGPLANLVKTLAPQTRYRQCFESI